MSTKVKGEAIKEGSIPYSALATEVKNKIENAGGGGGATPDWNATKGKAGYIENRTHYFDIIGGETLKDISVATDICADSNLKSHNIEYISEFGSDFMKLTYKATYTTYLEDLHIGDSLIKVVQDTVMKVDGKIFEFSVRADGDDDIFVSTIWIDVDSRVGSGAEYDKILEYAKGKVKETILVCANGCWSNKYFIKKTLDDKYLSIATMEEIDALFKDGSNNGNESI